MFINRFKLVWYDMLGYVENVTKFRHFEEKTSFVTVSLVYLLRVCVYFTYLMLFFLEVGHEYMLWELYRLLSSVLSIYSCNHMRCERHCAGASCTIYPNKSALRYQSKNIPRGRQSVGSVSSIVNRMAINTIFNTVLFIVAFARFSNRGSVNYCLYK